MKHLLLIIGLLFGGIASAQELVAQDFHANGKLHATRFNDGTMEHFITYFETGRVQAMGSYRNGLREGSWKQFAENGTVVTQAQFVNGQRQGVWEFRKASGPYSGRLYYENGRLVGGEQYDAAGALVAQRNY